MTHIRGDIFSFWGCLEKRKKKRGKKDFIGRWYARSWEELRKSCEIERVSRLWESYFWESKQAIFEKKKRSAREGKQIRSSPVLSRYDYNMLHIFPFHTFRPYLLILGSFWCLIVDIRYYACLWNLRLFFFMYFMSGSTLAPLALFLNNLCISLFMNNLNMDPSLNLIIKDHALTFFWFHHNLAHWQSMK